MMVELQKAQLLALHLGRLKDEGRRRARAGQPRQAQQRPRGARHRPRGADDPRRERHHAPSTRSCATPSNLESVLTYEGTSEIHTLILGQAMTGESAFT